MEIEVFIKNMAIEEGRAILVERLKDYLEDSGFEIVVIGDTERGFMLQGFQ